MRHFAYIAFAIIASTLASALASAAPTQPSQATLEIIVVDKAGQRLPCRVHLKDAAGSAQRAAGLPFWHDHFVCPGFATLQLQPGKYAYEIERGPEYRGAAGSVELSVGRRSELSVTLQRIANMSERGWWSGELHVHRAVEEMPLHLRAEDLHVAPVITWWNGRNLWRDRALPDATLVKVDEDRFYDVMAGEDEREGGALLYYGLKQPLPLPGDAAVFPEHPSPLHFVDLARQQEQVAIDIEKPFWWDTPLWLASGKIDSIGLANNHMCRSSMYETEAWGKPRDERRLPPPRGNGYWTQELYYQVLNCGFRVPPSAGSASGVLPNPVGYNRVYVHLGSTFSYAAWWQGLKTGRSFVTNGPLLLCRANRRLPGHVFQAAETLEIALDMEIIATDCIPAVEIVQDGRVEQTIPLDRTDHSRIATRLKFEQSGWFLVRAVADDPKTFRFASTAPFYVEIGNAKSRISRRSVQFFLEWLDERAARVARKCHDPEKLREVLLHHDEAKKFWQQLLIRANSD